MATRLPYVDYVLVYKAADRRYSDIRNLFEESLKQEGLKLESDQLGEFVFVKIFCSFERLAQQAELNHMKFPLKGCVVPRQPKTVCGRMLKLFSPDDTVDLVSAPFEKSKLQLYEGGDDTSTFFRSSVRNLLVHQILISVDIRDQLNESTGSGKLKIGRSCRRGLLHLVMIKAYADAFVLHDKSIIDDDENDNNTDLTRSQRAPKIHVDPRCQLKKVWLSWYKFQPLWQIRNYFGEKVALYFAWLGHYIFCLWLIAIVGLAIFIYGVQYRFSTNPIHLCEVTTSGNISTLNNNTSTKCGTFATVKHLAAGVLDTADDAFDNRATPFFSVVICIWSFLFMKLWSRESNTLVYRWDVDNFKDSEPDRPEFVGTSFELDPITNEVYWVFPMSRKIRRYLVSVVAILFMVLIVFTSVALVILFKVSVREMLGCPTGDENVVDQKKYDSTACFFSLTFAPAIFNAISIMILSKLYAKLARSLTKWENHRTKSSYNDALILKLFAFQFANNYSSLFYIAFFRPDEHFFQRYGVFGIGTRYKDVCARGTCMSLLSFQVLVLMLTKPFPKLMNDIVFPWAKSKFRQFRKCCRSRCRASRSNSVSDTRPIRNEDQLQIDWSENIFEREFRKPSTGDFTLSEYMLFAASFPLAPLLALLINLFDMRVDARRLLCWNRRPIGHVAADIGMWHSIMYFLNFCGVVSNALLVAYTSAFCSDYFGDDVTSKERLTTLVIFEHLVFAIVYLLLISVSNVPSSIQLAMKKERHQVAKLLENAVNNNFTIPRRSVAELRRIPSLSDAIGRPQVQLQRNLAAVKLSPIRRPIEMRQINNETSVKRRLSDAEVNPEQHLAARSAEDPQIDSDMPEDNSDSRRRAILEDD